MAMGSGSGPGGLNADINVTPLIDVLLVLLIIFMVIVPITPHGLEAQVPQPPKNPNQQKENDLNIVVSIVTHGGGQPTYMINQDTVPKADLQNRLNAIFSIRAEKVIFIKGDPDLNYSEVAEIVDMARGLGIDHIGLVTPKIAAGQ
jgi:biopolymer transport protein ExbD